MSEKTSLYVVPTPIGNMEDITYRAVRILTEADFILAEDTRKTGLLLKHLEIKQTMRSYHGFNEHQVTEKVVRDLSEGKVAALVSDAGTPAVSDPGFMAVRACLEAGLKVECLPGPTAFVPALVKSGLPADRFVFEGFLPRKKGRKTRWDQLSAEKRTFILYESPHRLLKCLEEIAANCGDERPVSVSREISKLHEETFNGSAAEAFAYFTEKAPRGEFVIVVGGAD